MTAFAESQEKLERPPEDLKVRRAAHRPTPTPFVRLTVPAYAQMFRKLAVFAALALAAIDPAAAFVGTGPVGSFRPALRQTSNRAAIAVGPSMELTIVTGARYFCPDAPPVSAPAHLLGYRGRALSVCACSLLPGVEG